MQRGGSHWLTPCGLHRLVVVVDLSVGRPWSCFKDGNQQQYDKPYAATCTVVFVSELRLVG